MRTVEQLVVLGTLPQHLFAVHQLCMLKREGLLSLTLICGGLLKSATCVHLVPADCTYNLWQTSFERGCCKEDDAPFYYQSIYFSKKISVQPS